MMDAMALICQVALAFSPVKGAQSEELKIG